MKEIIPYTETYLPCWTLDITYHDKITYKPITERCIHCAIFKSYDTGRYVEIYYTPNDWLKQQPNKIFSDVIEMEGVCNGQILL